MLYLPVATAVHGSIITMILRWYGLEKLVRWISISLMSTYRLLIRTIISIIFSSCRVTHAGFAELRYERSVGCLTWQKLNVYFVCGRTTTSIVRCQWAAFIHAASGHVPHEISSSNYQLCSNVLLCDFCHSCSVICIQCFSIFWGFWSLFFVWIEFSQ